MDFKCQFFIFSLLQGYDLPQFTNYSSLVKSHDFLFTKLVLLIVQLILEGRYSIRQRFDSLVLFLYSIVQVAASTLILFNFEYQFITDNLQIGILFSLRLGEHLKRLLYLPNLQHMLPLLALQQLPQSLALQKAIQVLALRIHLKTIIIMSKQALNMARIAEQTERYDDMVRSMKESIKLHLAQKNTFQKWLGEQQMRLLGAAFKCKINSRRTAWRALSILYAKQANSKNRSASIMQLYKDSIEKEIREIAQDGISTLDNLPKNLLTPALRLQFWKMKGDLQRYLCQIAKESQQLKRLQKETQASYRNGVTQARENQKKQNNQNQKNKGSIETYDSRRLAIFLNLSVFYYEIAGSVSKAIETCEQGFSSALEKIGDLQQAKYIDSVTIMQLMHDNITAWRSQKDQKK